MSLDLVTIFVVTVFVTGICGLLLLYSWLLSRNTIALALWAAGYFIASIGTMLVVARDVIPTIWSIEIANALIAFAYGLVWSGARSFNDRRTPVSLILAGALVWLVACQVEAFYASPQARATLMAAVVVGYTVLCAFEFWRARDHGLKSRWPIIVFLLLHAAVYLTRTLQPGLLPLANGAQGLSGGVAALAFEWMFVAVCAAFLFTHLARERIELRYKHASVIDPLTSVANRRAFIEDGARLLRRIGVEQRDAALLSFDLDRFKQINDTLGHHAGDQVLCAFCDVAVSALRPGDLFGRLGGEEFACLLPHITLPDALQVAERIRAQFVATPLDLGAGPHGTTVSIGVAMSTESDHDLARLMVAADRALYRAKAKGGNCVEPRQARFVRHDGAVAGTRRYHPQLAARAGSATKRPHTTVPASDFRLLENVRPLCRKLLANMPPQFSSTANKSLREANRRLDVALENMSQGLCLFDPEGRLVLCNERYIQMYRLPREEVKPGRTIRELLALRQANGTFVGDPDEYSANLRTRIADGRTFSSVVEAADGRVTVIVDQPIKGGGWVATFEDVTERRRIEAQIAHMAHQVIHLNRTAIAGVLSASFAHELNQPLGAILSNAETAEVLLADNPLNVDQLKEILADIRRDNQRAGEIIKQLGALLKKGDEIELQEFDLNDTVRCALHLLDHEAATRGVVLRANQAHAALPVRANMVHLQQVILNLAMNGMDAMACCDRRSRKLTLETALAGDADVEASVSDSGTGIPADMLERVFDAFVTTKPQGTGLGLSIARTIIEIHGGKIWAENRPEGGAVFRFTLPLAKTA
jgi:diguanylate cyclase (GGDEF)-like protein